MVVPARSGQLVDFGRGWLFHRGESPGATRVDFDDSAWENIRLPHTFNASDTFAPPRGYYRGPAWYRKSFRVRSLTGRTSIRFDAAWGAAHVWLNGSDLGEHIDGLVGFEIDLTPLLQKGLNVLAVRVDNSHHPRILPGKKTPDYNIYGGLCGDAWMVRKRPPSFPWRSLVVTTPEIDGKHAHVNITTTIFPHSDRPARAQATITQGKNEVSRTGLITPSIVNTLSFHLEIPDPSLWSPDAPHLYQASVKLFVDDTLWDDQNETFGIRRFRFDERQGFLLNGERLQLRGVNRHQDFPGLGNVLPERLHRRDAELIKEMGANFVRTSHYPQSPSFLAACDELGILVYEEITTWQYVGGEPFLRSAEAMMREMIRRDRNHPSVILWGMFNEGRSRRLLERLKKVANDHDPSRPTIYAENKLSDGAFLGTIFVPDVLGVNYKLESLEAFHSAYPRIKILVSEHTNADNTTLGDMEAEKRQAERIADDLDLIESMTFVSGSTLWSMHDYGTDYEPVWPVQRSGIVDAYRRPKEAFHMLRSRWCSAPVLHIASDWSLSHQRGEPVEVRVYTNLDEVELRRNGESLGVKEGSNPLVWSVPYAEGEITAIGRGRGGKDIIQSVATPGSACRIVLDCPKGLIADGRDGNIVSAKVLDASGIPVPAFEGDVTFHLRGPGHLRGPTGTTVRVARGTAVISLVSSGRRGKIILEARAKGLEPAQCELEAL